MESSAASASTPAEAAEEKIPVDLLGLADELSMWNPRSFRHYDVLKFIDKGSHMIYKGRERKTGQLVALKAIKRDGERLIPLDAQSEIVMLNFLKHENIIRLKEITMSPVGGNDEQGKPDVKYRGAYMVSEYMEHDLFHLVMQKGAQFTVPQIKCYMKQLLRGIQHCHDNQVIHRDIKSANILVNNEGYLKLAYFGLACMFPEEGADLTDTVVCLWYRAPELLLGEKKYGSAIDMWAVGCIFAELLIRAPLFVGIHKKHQFDLICQICGTPDEDTWPGVSKLPNYQSYKLPSPVRGQDWERFQHFGSRAVGLLKGMLTLNPAKRISAEQALDADYFREDPRPCDRQSLPKYPETHKFQPQRKRQLPDSQERELAAGPETIPPADQEGGIPDATDRQRHGQKLPGFTGDRTCRARQEETSC